MNPRPLDTPDPSTRVIAVVGPTAAGKTALAEELAVRLNGEIVSADSMQVYTGMDIGTAKPPIGARRVAYHCIDIADPGTPFSAALYQHASRVAIADCTARRIVPILAGGTGLYVRAALDDFSFPPGERRDNPTRDGYEALAAETGAVALHTLLSERDPASATLIHPNNVRRVIRALEMADEGTSYAAQHAGFSRRRSIYDACFVGVTMRRSDLYDRIDARVDRMLAEGLAEEVEHLLASGLRSALTAAQAIGYKELVAYLEGDLSLDEAAERIRRSTRHYAKRQLSWFRADPRITWIDVTDSTLSEQAADALAALRWTDTATPGK